MRRFLLGLGAAAAVIALPAAASAYTAQVATALNLRTCASARCAVITVLPRGAYVNVIAVYDGWDYLTYAGFTGYASAAYISPGYARPLPPPPPPFFAPYPSYPSFGLGFFFGPQYPSHDKDKHDKDKKPFNPKDDHPFNFGFNPGRH